jgi:hypothetical protein
VRRSKQARGLLVVLDFFELGIDDVVASLGSAFSA